MSSKPIILSSAGLRNLINNDEEFIFIFENHEIRMNKVFAEFISPRVSNLHRTDPTIESINIKFRSPENSAQIESIFSEDIIELLIKVSSGEIISINEEQSNKMRLISILLGNEELLKKINEIYPPIFNLTNADIFLQNYQYMHYLSEQAGIFDFSSLQIYADTISSHFYEIDRNKLFQLPKKILYEIISNNNLKIESEDSLFDFINELFHEENEEQDEFETPMIILFFEQILIEFLSTEKLSLLLRRIKPSKVTNKLWDNLCRRMENGFQNQTNSRRYVRNQKEKVSKEEKSFLYDGNEANQFKGIIHKLTEECGGNVCDKGVVTVSASSVYSSTYEPKYVVDLDNNNKMLFSNDLPNSWIKFDFKERKINPTHYSIKSHTTYVTKSHLKEWVIEGSNDDNDWVTLDSRNNDTSLNNYLACNTFQIKSQNQFFQYIRLKQTGPNNYNRNLLAITSIEFFGKLKMLGVLDLT